MSFSMMQERPRILLVLKIMIRDHMKLEAKAPKIFPGFSPLSQNTTPHRETRLLQFLVL
jgi:hypothetical protein